MRYFLLVIIVCIAMVSKTTAQNNSDEIIGFWMSTDNKVEVEIYKCENEYKAKIIWLDDSNDRSRPMKTRKDKNNPNPALRERKLIGLVVMNGLIYNHKQHNWKGGQIYDPDTGKELDAKVWLSENKYLKVRGFLGFEFIGKNLSFKKVL